MIILKDELKELELIQKELEQARIDIKRLEDAKWEILQRFEDIKDEVLRKLMIDGAVDIEL
jgi:hypothetical protein